MPGKYGPQFPNTHLLFDTLLGQISDYMTKRFVWVGEIGDVRYDAMET